MINVQYLGVYWIDRKDELSGDTFMCVFHVKGNKAERIRFGGYSERLEQFWDQVNDKCYDQKRVDYWMPIPVLPEKEI